jgi:hypothetical protein
MANFLRNNLPERRVPIFPFRKDVELFHSD